MERKEKLLAEREEVISAVRIATEALRKLTAKERSLQYVDAFMGTGSDEDYKREEIARRAQREIKEFHYRKEPWVLRCLMFDAKRDWKFAMDLGSKQLEAALKTLDDNETGSFTSSRLHSWLVKEHADFLLRQEAGSDERSRKHNSWAHLLEHYALRATYTIATLRRHWRVSWKEVELCAVNSVLTAGRIPKSSSKAKERSSFILKVSKVEDAESLYSRKAQFEDDTSGEEHAYHVIHFTFFDRKIPKDFVRSLKEFADLILRPEVFQKIPQYVGYKVMKDAEETIISLVVIADSTVADIWNTFSLEMVTGSDFGTSMDFVDSLEVCLDVYPQLKDLFKRKRICLHAIKATFQAKIDRRLVTLVGESGNLSGIRTDLCWPGLPEYTDNPLYRIARAFDTVEKTTRRLKVTSRIMSYFIEGQVIVTRMESLFRQWIIEATVNTSKSVE